MDIQEKWLRLEIFFHIMLGMLLLKNLLQGQEFEKEIAPCTKIIYFEVSDATMTERLINRGKSSGRVDDNVETIKKRLNTFHQHSKPVIEAYSSKCVIVSVKLFV